MLTSLTVGMVPESVYVKALVRVAEPLLVVTVTLTTLGVSVDAGVLTVIWVLAALTLMTWAVKLPNVTTGVLPLKLVPEMTRVVLPAVLPVVTLRFEIDGPALMTWFRQVAVSGLFVVVSPSHTPDWPV